MEYNSIGASPRLTQGTNNANPKSESWPELVPSACSAPQFPFSNFSSSQPISKELMSSQYYTHTIPPNLVGGGQMSGIMTPNILMNSYTPAHDMASGFNSPSTFSDNFSFVLPSINANRYENNNGNYNSISNPFNMNKNNQPLASQQIQNMGNGFEPVSTSLETICDLLLSSNQDEVIKSAQTLYYALKNDSTRTLLKDKQHVIIATMRAIDKNQANGLVLRFLAACIYYISLNKESISNLYAAGVLDLFDKACSAGSDALLYYLISAIHSIFLTFSDSRDFFKNFNQLSKFLKLLTHKNDKFLAIITDCLCICVKNLAVSYMVADGDFVSDLIAILRNRTYEKLLFNSCRLLKEISSSNVPKTAIINAGAIQVLTKLLLHFSRRVAVTALLTVRNLSDAVSSQTNLDELISILIKFVSSQLGAVTSRQDEAKRSVGGGKMEEQLVACSLCILGNLTCNNPKNKEFLISKGFVSTMIKVCNNIHSTEVLEPAASTIRHLTCRNSKAMEACEELINSQGLVIVINLIKRYSSSSLNKSSSLKKILFGILANFASNRDILVVLRDLKVTLLAAHTMAAVMEELKKISNLAPPVGMKLSSWKLYLLNCNKLLEVCVILLYLLTRDESSLNLMISSSVLISLFSKLLISTAGPTLVYVINFLHDISNTQSGLSAVEHAFSSIHQTEVSCLQSNTDNICIERLKQFHSRSQYPISQLISELFSNLSKTGLSIYIESIPFLSQNENLKEHDNFRFLQNELNNFIDSPPITLSPDTSRIIDQC